MKNKKIYIIICSIIVIIFIIAFLIFTKIRNNKITDISFNYIQTATVSYVIPEKYINENNTDLLKEEVKKQLLENTIEDYPAFKSSYDTMCLLIDEQVNEKSFYKKAEVSIDKINSVKFRGDSATVEFELIFLEEKYGEQESKTHSLYTVTLKKIDNKWVVFNYNYQPLM